MLFGFGGYLASNNVAIVNIKYDDAMRYDALLGVLKFLMVYFGKAKPTLS